MKKIWYKSAATSLVMLTVVGCNDFGDMNVNPNNPSVPVTASLLTGAQRSVGTLNGQVGPAATNSAPALYVQQISDVTYVEESRYKTVNFNYSGWYTGPLNSFQQIINLNTDADTKVAAAAYGSNANQIATARIMKAYVFQWLTDRWGDIPYSQALKGVENFSPAFDKQQDIYNDLFKEWKEAAAQFDGGTTVKGDIILNGNIARWKKFANSLRLIAALRISEADAAKGATEFKAAMADGVLASNADNVQYKYLSDLNNENPLYNNYQTTNRKDFGVSDTFIGYLQKVNDPRLPFIAAKNNLGEYRGVPYAVFPVTWKAQDISLIAPTLSAQTAPLNILTYAQVMFAQAEAAYRGWISDDAKTLYEAAIQASMKQWMGSSYTDEAYTAYIAQPEVAYDQANALERIGNQRWIALFFQGTEAWNSWRRTGFPKLTPAASPLNGGTEIPVRLAYPVTANTLNQDNYKEVVARQGEDDQYTPVWWDK